MLLQCWALAYRTVGEAALPPFGLSEADIDAILTVDEAAWRRWAESAAEPGRAPARPAHRTAGRQRASRPQLRGPRPRAADDTGDRPAAGAVNGYLLATWRRAATEPEWSRRFALDSEDVAALTAAEDSAVEQWSRLPIALATPRPGLLAGLFEREEPRLVAFLSALQR